MNPLTFATIVPYMQKTKVNKRRYWLKWIGWVVVAQIILVNISASIYAYRFTHFYDAPPGLHSAQNIFHKTWKLFTGPKFYKNTKEPEPSFPFENITLTTSDSISIDGWYSAVDSSKGCVIFFHGLTVNKSFLEPEAAQFRQWGYNVLLLDLRAHGKSGGNTSSIGMKETEEVKLAFDYAEQRGNKKIILYGVSLGASICLKAVADANVQPAGIIADVPFRSLHDHFKSRAKMVGFPSEPFATLVTMWIGIRSGYNPFRHNMVSYAKKVGCPVLVEWGMNDPLVKESEVKSIYSNLSSKNKKLVIYPDASHGAFLRDEAKTWTNETQAFLNSLQ